MENPEQVVTEESVEAMEDFLFGVHPLSLMAFATALLVWCVIVYVVQGGLFAQITVKTVEPKRNSMTVAYKTGKGPYKGAGELFTDICSIVLNCEHIGIYYDDPDAVAPADLRYAVGAILATGNKEPDPADMELCLKHGYKIVHFPRPNHVVYAEFPFRNTLSIYMGIFRVYPKLKEYIAVRGLCAYPAMEIYTSNNIEFVMPLSKQEEFFVPEFCDEQISIATTEFSNHPDQAAADEELKNKSEAVFVKPATPPPVVSKPDNENIQESEEDEEKEDDDDEESSEFEKLEPEN